MKMNAEVSSFRAGEVGLSQSGDAHLSEKNDDTLSLGTKIGDVWDFLSQLICLAGASPRSFMGYSRGGDFHRWTCLLPPTTGHAPYSASEEPRLPHYVRFLSPSLGKGPVLHIPSNTTYSKSDELHQAGQGQGYPCSTNLTKARLVSLPALPVCPATAQASDCPSSPVPGPGSCASVQPRGEVWLQAQLSDGSWD